MHVEEVSRMATGPRTRLPQFEGAFYPAGTRKLDAAVQQCYDRAREAFRSTDDAESRNAPPVAVVSPHAGYIYSGAAAAAAYFAIPDHTELDLMVIVGPNHTGLGEAISISGVDQWEVAGQTIQVDRQASDALTDAVPLARRENMAHIHEHSLEVQIPLLNHRVQQGYRLLPVALGLGSDERGLQQCLELGEALAGLLRDRKALMIASTDMSHYLSAEEARLQDGYALDAIRAMDPAGLVHSVRKHGITMCGVMATAAVLQAALTLGSTQATLCAYTNSGEATGDHSQVVSYASFIVD